MISPKKLIKLAKKWQKLATSKRKRITLPRTTGVAESESCSTFSMAEKGHFVVYTADQRRFEIPLGYLKNNIIRELFAMAEYEFGFPSGGPITLPCDAVFMKYVVSLMQRHAAKVLEKAVLLSLVTRRCLPTSNLCREQSNQQSLLHGF